MRARRPQLSTVLSAVVSVVAVVAVVLWISRQQTPSLPDSAAGFGWLALAFAGIAAAMGLRGYRWHRVMVHAGVRHRRRDAYGLLLVSYMGNNVLPARGGEVLRIALMGARGPARRREVLGTVIAERLLDVVALLLLLIATAVIGSSAAGPGWVALDAAVLVLAGLALGGYVWLRRHGRFESFAARIRPVARASRIFVSRAGVLLGALSVGIWLVEALTMLLVARSVGAELSVPEATTVIVLASLFAALPAAPGYAGTYDAGILLALHAAGVQGGEAVGVLLLSRIVFFVPVTACGLGVLVVGYGGLHRLRGRRPVVTD